MKKLVLLLLACASTFVLRAQQHENCTTDESILLNERPAGISEREALDIIRGIKSQFIASYEGEERYSQLINFPLSRLSVFEKRAKITLEKRPGETLPRWQTFSYYVPIRTDGLESYWWCLVIGFLFLLLFGLAIINETHRNLEWEDGTIKIRFAIIGIGLLLSILVGTALYTMSTVGEIGTEHTFGSHYQFLWWEAVFQVIGVFTGFLIYIGCHHLNLFSQKHRKLKKVRLATL